MIRRLEEKDIKRVEELELDTLGTTLGSSMLKNSINSNMEFYFVYEEKDILGYISTVYSGEQVEILNICVDKNNQNKKIGTKLLSYIINYFYDLKTRSFILDVRNNNLRAIHLYEKFGFKQIHTRKNYYSNGDDALIYEKKLDEILDIYKSYLSYASFLDNTNLKTIDFMHSSIYGINIDEYLDYPVSKLEEKDKDLLFDFYYNEIKNVDLDFANKYANTMINNLSNDKFDFFGIKNDNKLVSTLLVYKYNNSIEIEEVYVKEEYRNNKYFTTLFKYVIDYYLDKEIKDVFLSVDIKDTTYKIYQKMGFM